MYDRLMQSSCSKTEHVYGDLGDKHMYVDKH